MTSNVWFKSGPDHKCRRSSLHPAWTEQPGLWCKWPNCRNMHALVKIKQVLGNEQVSQVLYMLMHTRMHTPTHSHSQTQHKHKYLMGTHANTRLSEFTDFFPASNAYPTAEMALACTSHMYITCISSHIRSPTLFPPHTPVTRHFHRCTKYKWKSS